MTTLLLIEHVPASSLIIGMIIFVALCLVCSYFGTPAKKATSKRKPTVAELKMVQPNPIMSYEEALAKHLLAVQNYSAK